MSVHIRLADAPEYYTNLDTVRGEVGFYLAKPETIGAVVVKLEGEATTTLTVPVPDGTATPIVGWSYRGVALGDAVGLARQLQHDPAHPCPNPGAETKESHRIVYQVQQAFPPTGLSNGLTSPKGTTTLPPGQHAFPFALDLPFYNACADATALARAGDMVDRAASIRVMDATKQRQLEHVREALPPSATVAAAAAGAASHAGRADLEVRYFVKVTVQRPGLFRENWRHQVGFRFVPLEPPRPPPSTREIFARRPFAFKERALPTPVPPLGRKRTGLFGGRRRSSASVLLTADDRLTVLAPSPHDWSTATATGDGRLPASMSAPGLRDDVPPVVQVAAFLPFPAILTCGAPVPLRLTARKIAPSRAAVYLTALEVRLVGTTTASAQGLQRTSAAAWMVAARPDLGVVACAADAPVDTVVDLPDELWCARPLPGAVLPSFVTCNARRSYALEVHVTLSWGLPSAATTAVRTAPGGSKQERKVRKAALAAVEAQAAAAVPQTVRFPLRLEDVEVFSGVKAGERGAARGAPGAPQSLRSERVGSYDDNEDDDSLHVHSVGPPQLSPRMQHVPERRPSNSYLQPNTAPIRPHSQPDRQPLTQYAQPKYTDPNAPYGQPLQPIQANSQPLQPLQSMQPMQPMQPYAPMTQSYAQPYIASITQSMAQVSPPAPQQVSVPLQVPVPSQTPQLQLQLPPQLRRPSSQPRMHELAVQHEPVELAAVPALPPRSNTLRAPIRRRPVAQPVQPPQPQPSPQPAIPLRQKGTIRMNQSTRPQQPYHLYRQTTDAVPLSDSATASISASSSSTPSATPSASTLAAWHYDSDDDYDEPPPTYDEAMTSVLDLAGGLGSERPVGR